jgi:hypothetical protein
MRHTEDLVGLVETKSHFILMHKLAILLGAFGPHFDCWKARGLLFTGLIDGVVFRRSALKLFLPRQIRVARAPPLHLR